MFDVFKKLLMARELRFERGSIYMLRNRVTFFHPSTFSYIIMYSKDRPQTVKEMYYSAKKSFSETFINYVALSYKTKTKELIKIMFDLAMMAGWGEWTLVKLDEAKKHSIIHISNSPISEVIKNKKVKMNCPVDGLARGMHAGAAKVIFKHDVDAVETKCIAMGDPYCEFILKPTEEWKNEKDQSLRNQLFPAVK